MAPQRQKGDTNKTFEFMRAILQEFWAVITVPVKNKERKEEEKFSNWSYGDFYAFLFSLSDEAI